MTTLFIGLLPVIIPLAAHRKQSLKGFFIGGLVAIVLGVIVLQSIPLLSGAPMTLSLRGLGCLLGALTLWAWFAIKNSAFLQRRQDISRAALVSLMGLLSFVVVVSFCQHPDFLN